MSPETLSFENFSDIGERKCLGIDVLSKDVLVI